MTHPGRVHVRPMNGPAALPERRERAAGHNVQVKRAALPSVDVSLAHPVNRHEELVFSPCSHVLDVIYRHIKCSVAPCV